MDESIIQDDSLKQAWAEGYNVLDWDPSQDPSTWIDRGIPLPWRATVPYPFHQFPIGFLKVKGRFPLEVIRPRVRGLWTGALDALRGQVPMDAEDRFNEVVHWPFLVTTLTPSWIVSQTGPHAAIEPDAVLQWWSAHASHIQKTRAEQYLLQLGRRPPWHPYREATGAMRRAPLWGVLDAAIPAQAGALAYNDAVVAHAGWGTWTAYAVAQIAASLCAPLSRSLSDVFTSTIERLGADQPAANLLLDNCLTVCAKERSWDDRVQLILEPFAGYPEDHSLPNFAILVVAALSFSYYPVESAVAEIRSAGWDAIGNGLVFGALQGIHRLADPSKPLPAFAEHCVQRTVELLPKGPSFRDAQHLVVATRPSRRSR